MRYYGTFIKTHPLANFIVPMEADSVSHASAFMATWFNDYCSVISEKTYQETKKAGLAAGTWKFTELPVQAVPPWYG